MYQPQASQSVKQYTGSFLSASLLISLLQPLDDCPLGVMSTQFSFFQNLSSFSLCQSASFSTTRTYSASTLTKSMPLSTSLGIIQPLLPCLEQSISSVAPPNLSFRTKFPATTPFLSVLRFKSS